MPGSLRIGRLLGIPLQVNASWIIIFALVTYLLVAGGASDRASGDLPLFVVVAVLTSILFFCSVIAHEVAHSLVARMLGVPVRSITLFIFGGVAQIARDPDGPAGELFMAAAGPLTSLWLAVLFGVGAALLQDSGGPFPYFIGWLATINLSLALFNLLPGFPMDGGRIFRSLLWWATGRRDLATSIALLAGRILGWGFVALGVGQLLQRDLGGAWLIFIGWFLGQTVGATRRQARLRTALDGYNAGNLMERRLSWITTDATVQQAVEQTSLSRSPAPVLAVEGPNLRGVVNIGSISRVPRRRWQEVQVKDVMRPVAALPVIDPATSAADLLSILDDANADSAIVHRGGVVQGVVTHRSLYRATGPAWIRS